MRRKFFLQSAQSKRSADGEADATGFYKNAIHRPKGRGECG